ncbi:MAG: tetratricopeptide repeat protein [Kiritimatiellia bacterium]
MRIYAYKPSSVRIDNLLSSLFYVLIAGVFLLVTAVDLAADPVEMKDRLQLADGLFRRSLFELAASEYKSLAADPQTPERDSVMFRLAECYRRTGKRDEAAAVYQKLIEVFPDSIQIPRARLQRAMILMDKGGASIEEALKVLDMLTQKNTADDVRSAALYHKGEALEKLKRSDEALKCFELLRKDFPDSEYVDYAALKSAWLLSRKPDAESKRVSLGIYLNLAYESQDEKVAEEACYFAAQVSLISKKYEESANLFKMLRKKYPESPRIEKGALSAAWAFLYSGRYKEGLEILDLLMDDESHLQREEILYVRANCLRELSRNDEAVALYDQQLKLTPDGRLARKAHYEKLTTLYRTGKYAEVIEAIGNFTDPGEGLMDKVLWMKAESAMKTDQPDLVIQACRRLIEKCPDSSLAKDALYRLGWILQKQEAWEEASSWFLKVAQKYPDDPLAATSLYASGVCLVQLDQSEAALRDWTALLAKYPESRLVDETLYQKAMEEIRFGQHRAAGATLDELLRRYPESSRKAEILYWRGTVYHEMNDTVEAEKSFRACLAAKPSKEIERECILELGLLLQSTGKETEAAALFNKLLDSSVAEQLGEDKLAWLAEFQHRNKQYDSAAKAAYVLIKLKPDNGWQQTAWTVLGRVHSDKGERDPAIYAFQQALATGASTEYGAESALRLGRLLMESGRYEEARKSFDDAAARAAKPELIGLRARAYAGLAENAEQQGDVEAAIRYYISVGILFDHKEIVPRALHKAAILLEKQGRIEEADKMREELKQRYPGSPLIGA